MSLTVLNVLWLVPIVRSEVVGSERTTLRCDYLLMSLEDFGKPISK